MKRETFVCWAFGCRQDWITVRAASVKDARDLAAYRLRVHRSMVSVKRELPDVAGLYFVTV